MSSPALPNLVGPAVTCSWSSNVALDAPPRYLVGTPGSYCRRARPCHLPALQRISRNLPSLGTRDVDHSWVRELTSWDRDSFHQGQLQQGKICTRPSTSTCASNGPLLALMSQGAAKPGEPIRPVSSPDSPTRVCGHPRYASRVTWTSQITRCPCLINRIAIRGLAFDPERLLAYSAKSFLSWSPICPPSKCSPYSSSRLSSSRLIASPIDAQHYSESASPSRPCRVGFRRLLARRANLQDLLFDSSSKFARASPSPRLLPCPEASWPLASMQLPAGSRPTYRRGWCWVMLSRPSPTAPSHQTLRIPLMREPAAVVAYPPQRSL